MHPIGGYFELELPCHGIFPHSGGVLFNTGRNALEYILRALGNVKLLYIPYYTCDVVMEPVKKLGIPYLNYRINERLEIAEEIKLAEGECLLYTNYFGIKDCYCQQLTEKYGNQLIIDNAQAWFAKPTDCAGTLYSPRKFVGMPDGGIACCYKSIEVTEQDESYDRCSHLLKRYDLGASGGYEDFHTNSAKLHDQPIKRMSELTKAMLQSIDFERVKTQRWQNFIQLHNALGDSNLLDIEMSAGVESLSKSKSESLSNSLACPMVYPYLTSNANLKKHLISNKIFVATYWPNVFEWCKPDDLEYQLADRCLAIPIDQRYGEEEMKYIIETIKLKLI